MNIKHLFLFLAFIALQSHFGYAQIEPFELNVIPPSPNATSIGKYGDIPVSYSTGIPEINVPIFHLQGRELGIPISLNYHASGIKVEEMASAVGLGWTLNAGGAIVRTLRGRPDEEPFRGILNSGVIPDAVLSADVNQQAIYFSKEKSGELDFEPDIFNFSFIGKSGKFFLEKRDGIIKGYSIPYRDIDIVFENDGWILTDTDGTKYFFGDAAVDKTLSTSNSSGGRSSVRYVNYISAWYLNKIVSSKGEEIFFNYEPYTVEYCQRTSETVYFLKEGAPDSNCEALKPNYAYSEVEIQGVRLISITSSLGRVSFIYSDIDREDLPGDKALKAIQVDDYRGSFVKRYELLCSYFTTSGVGDASFSLCSDPSRAKRLRLDQVKEIGSDGTELPAHQFFYNKLNLPDKFSNAQDHWGYYNGASNTTLVPKQSIYRGNELVKISGASRQTSKDHVKASTLEKIIYPTGGYTIFEMECHEAYVDPDFYPYETDYSVPLVGYAGLRAQNGRYQYEDFEVNLPEYEPGVKGGTFNVHARYGSPCNPSEKSGCGGIATLIDLSNDAALYSSDGGVSDVTSTSKEIFLKNGRYRLELEIYDPSAKDGIVSAGVNGPDPNFVPPLIHKIGGLRIKSIKNYDERGNLANSQRFTYLSEVNVSESSGVVVSKPVYTYDFLTVNTDVTPGVVYTFDCVQVVRTANSIAPLSSTQGSAVGYEWVQVYQEGAVGNCGKTVYQFTTAKQYPDIHFYSFPFAPHTSRDWMRGLLLGKYVYKTEADQITNTLLQSTTNNYKTNLHFKEIFGLKMGCGGSGRNSCSIVKFQKYPIISAWYDLESTMQIDYTESGALETFHQFFYDNIEVHTFRTRSTKRNSGGDTYMYKVKYPLDYKKDVSLGISHLQTNHILDKKIEQQEWLNDKLISGQIFNYTVQGNMSLLENTFRFEIAAPVDDVNEMVLDGKYTAVITDSRYKQEASMSYDIVGNIIDYKTSPHQRNSTIIWGYNNSLPIAEVENASSHQVFYEDFEDSGTTGLSKTGEKCHPTGAYTVPFTPPDNLTYLISYWYWENSQWLFSGLLPFSKDINKGQKIDAIKVFPVGSKMTTFTYRPLIGITAKADSNENITFYEYDNYGRLTSVKDSKNNVVKSYKYNYYRKN